MKPLTDNSPMPFGHYEGMHMELVPVGYYNIFWNEQQIWNKEQEAVLSYVKENLVRLKAINPHLTWRKRLQTKK